MTGGQPGALIARRPTWLVASRPRHSSRSSSTSLGADWVGMPQVSVARAAGSSGRTTESSLDEQLRRRGGRLAAAQDHGALRRGDEPERRRGARDEPRDVEVLELALDERPRGDAAGAQLRRRGEGGAPLAPDAAGGLAHDEPRRVADDRIDAQDRAVPRRQRRAETEAQVGGVGPPAAGDDLLDGAVALLLVQRADEEVGGRAQRDEPLAVRGRGRSGQAEGREEGERAPHQGYTCSPVAPSKTAIAPAGHARAAARITSGSSVPMTVAMSSTRNTFGAMTAQSPCALQANSSISIS